MLLGSAGAQICIIGRTEFHTGIGTVGAGMAEALARSFPVSFLPTNVGASGSITLPSGRVLPVCHDPSAIEVSVFCDVLSECTIDPPGRLRYAWLLFDSDRLPETWVTLLNQRFDAVLAASPHLIEIARRSGVERPITHLPIPLDLDGSLALPARTPGAVLRFGSICAFHPRKSLETLVGAFVDRFGHDAGAELVLHGNLAFGTTLDRVRALASPNVCITHDDLSAAAKDALLGSFDVYATCSAGEGYAIGPREAMARGKVIVASAIGGHADLVGPPGVFMVPARRERPGHYPELQDGIFGVQHEVDPIALGDALEAAAAFVRTDSGKSARFRRERARSWSLSHLAISAAALVDPSIAAFRGVAPPDPAIAALAEQRLGRRADAIAGPRRQVCAAHDGGFFSVFNTYLSHLVWQQREDRCHAVLPDWDVERFLGRLEAPVRSFCYGQPGDGNLWTKLFQPLFGASEAEMNDAAFLWRHAELPADRHNEAREPLMTYVRAYKLYLSPDFAAFRRQYHRVFTQHVRLRPEHQAEIDGFAAAHLTTPILIAAHVRHPSHTVEQPTGQIAGTEIYIEQVRAAVRRRGADPDGPGWTVFVATDQDRVLHRFRAVFGERAVFFPDARRTRADEDAAFDALGPVERNQDGHQLQHLVAADRAGWSWRMAWEVVRDAYVMARCQALLHVVSNVSTAVAYMNPEIEMVFCDP